MAYHGPNPDRSRRRVTREQLDAARSAWDSGDFSDEWKPWRHLAAMQAGIIDAPSGTKWDSWADDSPSQRAMLIRAIRETPDLLRAAIRGARRPTWEAVIEGLLQDRDRQAGTVDERERDARWERRGEPSRDEAVASLRSIMDRIAP